VDVSPTSLTANCSYAYYSTEGWTVNITGVFTSTAYTINNDMTDNVPAYTLLSLTGNRTTSRADGSVITQAITGLSSGGNIYYIYDQLVYAVPWNTDGSGVNLYMDWDGWAYSLDSIEADPTGGFGSSALINVWTDPGYYLEENLLYADGSTIFCNELNYTFWPTPPTPSPSSGSSLSGGAIAGIVVGVVVGVGCIVGLLVLLCLFPIAALAMGKKKKYETGSSDQSVTTGYGEQVDESKVGSTVSSSENDVELSTMSGGEGQEGEHVETA